MYTHHFLYQVFILLLLEGKIVYRSRVRDRTKLLLVLILVTPPPVHPPSASCTPELPGALYVYLFLFFVINDSEEKHL